MWCPCYRVQAIGLLRVGVFLYIFRLLSTMYCFFLFLLFAIIGCLSCVYGGMCGDNLLWHTGRKGETYSECNSLGLRYEVKLKLSKMVVKEF